MASFTIPTHGLSGGGVANSSAVGWELSRGAALAAREERDYQTVALCPLSLCKIVKGPLLYQQV